MHISSVENFVMGYGNSSKLVTAHVAYAMDDVASESHLDANNMLILATTRSCVCIFVAISPLSGHRSRHRPSDAEHQTDGLEVNDIGSQ